jgi:hypothetical protein
MRSWNYIREPFYYETMLVFLIRSRKIFQVDYLNISDEACIPCRALAPGIAAIQNKLLPLTLACTVRVL